MKKIILAGGSGFLGKTLIRNLDDVCDAFVVLTRGKERTEGKVHYMNWDGENPGKWQTELESAVALINLSGKNVNCRYTTQNKQNILNSRINATRILGKTVEKLQSPPPVWINCSSSTIYPFSENTAMTEDNCAYGEGFSEDVCKQWEKCFFSFQLPHTRSVCLRIGMVMGKSGGVFPVLRRLTRLGLGGNMGNGRQMVSWLHEEDFARLVRWAILNEQCRGIYNCCAPNPLSNQELANTFRKKMNVTFGLPSPAWLLEIGSFFLRTETELVLKSRYVIPKKAMKQGFQFKFPFFSDSLSQLLQN